MGVGRTFAEAFAKAQLGSNSTMKKHGRALLSVREGDKERVVDLAAKLLKQASSWMRLTARRLCWAKRVSIRVW